METVVRTMLLSKGKMMHCPHFIGEFECRVLVLFITASSLGLLISTLYWRLTKSKWPHKIYSHEAFSNRVYDWTPLLLIYFTPMYIGQFWRSFRTALSGSIYVKAKLPMYLSLIMTFDFIDGCYELVVDTKFFKYELTRDDWWI